MSKRVADGIPADAQDAKKSREDVQDDLLRLVATSSFEVDPIDNIFWQLYVDQIEKFLKSEEGFRGKSKKRVQWTGFYTRRTEEYDVELPLDYYRVRVIRNNNHKLTLSAIQKDTGDMFIIRRLASADSHRIQKLFRTLMIHQEITASNFVIDRFLPNRQHDRQEGKIRKSRGVRIPMSATVIPTDTVMKPSELYIREGYVYTCTEYMESPLKEIIENPSTHFCVGRIIHQLLHLLSKMHKMGVIHGNINTSTVYFDSDMSIKLTDFGMADEATIKVDQVDAVKKDLIAIRSILAKLLLSSDAEGDKRIEEDDDELEWKSLAESSAESGLTDENSRDLLDLMFENNYSCDELLKHPYFQSFKVLEYSEPEYGELLDLSVKKQPQEIETNTEIV